MVLIVCVLAIFTTEGISFSAKSAKELGIVLLYANDVGKLNKTRIKQLQIGIDQTLEVDEEDFSQKYEKATEDPYGFLMIDFHKKKNHPSMFRKNFKVVKKGKF